MIGLVFMFIGGLIVGVIILLLLFISKHAEAEGRSKSPLERGLSTTGRVLGVFSLQLLVILVLFLVLDLEVVLVVAIVLGGEARRLSGSLFVGFIVRRLWAE